jgi:superfamily I DNA/RNA helicase
VNTLTLAVAGSGKTQSIVDRHGSTASDRVLVLTFTTANQSALASRLAAGGLVDATVHIQGWFSFLLQHWVRPYLPRLFSGRKLRGLNFDGMPANEFVTGSARYLDSHDRAYKRHLARLATEVSNASSGAVLDRLSRIYHRIWIDEVQDLNGYDLAIVEALFASSIHMHLVGDVRQAILQTNARDPKYSQFKGVKVKRWFDEHEQGGRLVVNQLTETWRCAPEIAALADSIFGAAWGFAKTSSRNARRTGHDGLFVVATEHVLAYIEAHNPLILRRSANSARDLDLDFINIGIAKGLEAERVLIAPTAAMREFLLTGKALDTDPACHLYVAVTRARASVAFVVDEPARFAWPVWRPSDSA